MGRSRGGRVGGCCLHVLHLKIVHRQMANHLSFMIRCVLWLRWLMSQKCQKVGQMESLAGFGSANDIDHPLYTFQKSVSMGKW